MRLVLSQDVPNIVREQVKPAVEKFVLESALTLRKIQHFILHPGGPRVLDAYRDAFGLEEGTIAAVRDSIRRHGNLSSAATLFILHDLVSKAKVHPGDKAVMVALGPGFAAEMILLSW
jgi:alkylresorcinol/alkylpyrone synthase